MKEDQIIAAIMTAIGLAIQEAVDTIRRTDNTGTDTEACIAAGIATTIGGIAIALAIDHDQHIGSPQGRKRVYKMLQGGSTVSANILAERPEGSTNNLTFILEILREGTAASEARRVTDNIKFEVN